MHTSRLLIIHDESDSCERLGVIARRAGFEATCASSTMDAMGTVLRFSPSAILLDLQATGTDPLQLLRLLSRHARHASILVMSAGEPRLTEAVVRLGTMRGLNIAGVLQRPLNERQVEAALSCIRHGTWTSEELAAAISRGQLSLRYQPKLARCGRTGAWMIDGVEALLRWVHDVHGTIMPSQFIPVAENADMMEPLTDLVLDRSLHQLRSWRARGVSLKLSVNVPPELIGDEAFPDRLTECLCRHGIEAERFVLEVTESTTVGEPALLADVLTRLRLKGIQVSIDDFGSGFSSLKRLLYLPFSELKIDGSLVGQVHRSEEARTVVRSTIELAHSLGMTVCAEHVDTREAFAFLEKEGCDQLQGFLIAEPLSAGDLIQLLGGQGREAGIVNGSVAQPVP